MTDKKLRPPFLSALCVLTFIGSGFAFFAYFFTAVFFEKACKLIIEYSSWDSVDQISPLYFTLLMALFCFSLIGAIRMWKFHRDGLIIYILAQVIILFLPSIWIGWDAFSVTNSIFTAIFISGYLFHYKILK
ncbi:MAG: hypothetical protein JXR31_16700 [Prolixibacteraceae bacterium]|nr:hypothetical protein [Prolixibacteraceae bacterium]MBN2775898.1 hypothetical protein [Prolixibacteraceae bacterium]